MRHVPAVALLTAIVACGTPATPAPTRSVGPTLDPIVAQHLQLNNATFDVQPAPATVSVSAQRSVELASVGLTGNLTASRTTFGELRAPKLTPRSDRFAWLVELDGLAPPAPAGGPTPVGPRKTFVFIDSEDGRGLMSVGVGAGPPQ